MSESPVPPLSFRLARGLSLDQNLVHHAKILMQLNMTVEQACSGNRRIPKTHPKLHTVIGSFARPIGNFDRIAQNVLRSRFSIHLQQLKVNLMNVEGMRF